MIKKVNSKVKKRGFFKKTLDLALKNKFFDLKLNAFPIGFPICFRQVSQCVSDRFLNAFPIGFSMRFRYSYSQSMFEIV